MTIEEAIALVKIERECVIRSDVCDRKCEKCDLLKDSTELTDMYEQLAEWLEELKAIKDGGIPIIHGKAELELHDKEIRNKAIDDFAELIHKKLYIYDTIDNLAENLKAGGTDEM